MIKDFRFLVTVCSILVTIACTGGNSLAQTIVNPDSALQTILINLEGTSLSLSQAQQYALENSTSVKQAEAVYLASLGTLRRERGTFDPEFFLSFNYEDQKIPSASRATTLSTVALITKIPYVFTAVIAGQMLQEGKLNVFSLGVAIFILTSILVSSIVMFIQKRPAQ